MRGLQETVAIVAVSAGFAGNAAPAAAETHAPVAPIEPLAGQLFGEQADIASTASFNQNETQVNESGRHHSGNNLVAEGVHSHAELMRLAKGGKDSVGHSDIDEAWARYGITPQVASKMVLGKVCSTDGLMSEGREHSPDPSADKPFYVNGSRIFERPLSVWGKTCYEAWVGEREDGQEVAVLVDCGNGEGRKVPEATPQVHVLFDKEAKDLKGKHIKTPNHIFRATIDCTDEGEKLHKKVTINHDPQKLADCDTGKPVTVKELKALGTQEWKLISPAHDRTTRIAKRIDAGMRKGSMLFKYTNQMVGKPIVPKKPETKPEQQVVNNETCVANNSPNAEVCVIKTTVVQPPEVVVVPPADKNVPPTGHLFPELHEYVKDRQPVCVEDVKDADGDIVKVKFRFVNTQGAPVGQQIGEVYKQDQADGSDTECVIYEAPANPQEVTVYADLDDGHKGADGKADHVVTKKDVLHIVPDQFLK